MEQNQRFLLFMVASIVVLFGWAWLNQALKPPAKNPPPNPQVVAEEGKPPAEEQQEGAEGPDAENAAEPEIPDAEEDAVAAVKEGAEDPEAETKDPQPDPKNKIEQFPQKTVQLGSTDSDSDYRLSVLIDSRGATIQQIQLNDPRYRSLKDHDQPLKVVGDIGDHDPEKFLKQQQQQDQLVLKVNSIFRRHCFKCHATKNPSGGFRMNTREGLLAGGDTGVAIIPGNPEDSLLVQAIRWENPPIEYAPSNRKCVLSAEAINDIVRWIEEGDARR